MTDIRIEREGNALTIDAEGHATGSVEACAIISAVLQTLAEGENARAANVEPGRAHIEATCGDELYKFISALLLSLAATVPDAVRVSVVP